MCDDLLSRQHIRVPGAVRIGHQHDLIGLQKRNDPESECQTGPQRCQVAAAERVFETAVNLLKTIRVASKERPIARSRNDHVQTLPRIWSMKKISPLLPETNAMVSHKRSKKGLRQRSVKARPTTNTFLEKARRRNHMPAATDTTSRMYGKLVEMSYCQLLVILSVVIHAPPNSPAQKLGISLMYVTLPPTRYVPTT